MNSTKSKKTVNPQKILKASEICRIIESCKRSGVNNFQMGSLHIVFGEPLPKWPERTTDLPQGMQTNEDSGHQGERKLSEEQLDELKLTDPAAYERIVVSGE